MEAIIIYLLKSSGILTIFFIAYQLFLKKETFFTTNRHFLLSGFLASMILPFVEFTKYEYVEPETFNPVFLLNDLPIQTNMVEQPEPFDWTNFLMISYFAIVCILIIRFIMQLLSLFKLIATNDKKLVKGFKLVEVQYDISPFSFFNFIIYNPEKYNSEDLNIILNHEKAHGKQLHSLDIIIAHLFAIIQWFNPFAWFYKKSIQQNLEFMADQSAISKTNCSKHYQHTLLKASLKPQYASITNNFYNSLIKKRIVMLNQSKSHIKNSWKYFIILPALSLFLMSFNIETIEIVKEPKNADISSGNLELSEENLIDLLARPEENSNNSQTLLNTENQSKSDQKNPIKIKIDKNTSDSDLKNIVKTLKDQNIEFSFDKVKRNSENEITSINVAFKDDNGNSGNYSLSNDKPINTFYFIKEDDGTIGFSSEKIRVIELQKIEEAAELAKAKQYMSQEQKQELEELKKDLQEQKEQIKVIIKENLETAKEDNKEKLKNYEIIIKDHEKAKKLSKKTDTIYIDKNSFGKGNVIFIVDGDEVDQQDIKGINPNQILRVNVVKGDKAIVAYGERAKDGVVEIITKEQKGPWKIEYGVESIDYIDDDSDFKEGDFSMHLQEENNEANVKFFDKHLPNNSLTMLVKKSSTEDYLNRSKSLFQKEYGIDIKYSKIKRNKAGEITRIKVSLKDDAGNESSATFDNGNDGIPQILLGKQNDKLIIKSI